MSLLPSDTTQGARLVPHGDGRYTWNRRSALSSPQGKDWDLGTPGRPLMMNQDSLWVHHKKIHNDTQPLFLCGLQGILEVLIKPEKPLVRRGGVQLLEGKKRRAVGLPWVSF